MLPDREVEFLKDVVSASSYSDVRQAALLRLRDRSCTDALLAAVVRTADSTPEVRVTALGILAACGSDETLTDMRAALLDAEENVRVAAAGFMLSFPKAKAGKTQAPAKGKVRK